MARPIHTSPEPASEQHRHQNLNKLYDQRDHQHSGFVSSRVAWSRLGKLFASPLFKRTLAEKTCSKTNIGLEIIKIIKTNTGIKVRTNKSESKHEDQDLQKRHHEDHHNQYQQKHQESE